MYKQCSKCKEFKSPTHFSRKKEAPDGLMYYCRKCNNAASRESKARNKGRVSATNLWQTHGITVEQYSEMLDAQGKCCAICGRSQDEFAYRLCVDHCHKTNKIRGILCNSCNTALGQFQDDTVRMQIAIEYLERNKA